MCSLYFSNEVLTFYLEKHLKGKVDAFLSVIRTADLILPQFESINSGRKTLM